MVRRVVTGNNAQGRSVVVSDEVAHERSLLPVRDLSVADVWGADDRVRVPTDGGRPDYARFFPPAHGFRVMVLRIGPEGRHESDGHNVDDYQRRREAVLPGYFEDAVIDDHGSHLHRTHTVDVGVVLEGRVSLHLDDGAVVELGAGDFVVQNGARHSWHNESEEECVLAVFVVGAERA
jgi:mannose-6-phosphate isomerase-like protein (cupin superfamily)